MRQLIYIVCAMSLCGCEVSDLGEESQQVDGPDLLALPGEEVPETQAAWLVPGDVESIADLPGRYYQPFALPGQISVMTLGAIAEGTGDYELYRSCGIPACIAESGSYHAVPENPAIGFAFFVLRSSVSAVPETYVVDLYWRGADDGIVALQVRQLLPTDSFGPTTIFWRIPPASPGTIGARSPNADPRVLASAAQTPPDITGTFVRPLGVHGDIGALTFRNVDADDPTRIVGAYAAAYPYCLPWCFPEDGAFELEIANALTGTGVLRLESGSDEKRYVVLAIWRTPQGIVGALQLQRSYEFGAVGPPFTMHRQWWTNDPVVEAAAANSSACIYYQGLAEYYATRALQCAYSVCYPLSPVYGYWAEYYRGLAEAHCSTP